MIYFRKRTDFTIYKYANETRFDIPVEAYADETGTITVAAGDAVISDADNWLVKDGRLYSIVSVQPGKTSTEITVGDPLRMFARTVAGLNIWTIWFDVALHGGGETEFLQSLFSDYVIAPDDTEYAMSYVSVDGDAGLPFAFFNDMESMAGDPSFSVANLVSSLTIDIYQYLRRIRAEEDVFLTLTMDGNDLKIYVSQRTFATKNLAPGDGNTFIEEHAYGSADTVGRGTVFVWLQGASDFYDWTFEYYLTEDGEITDTAPTPRVHGQWKSVIVELKVPGSTPVADLPDKAQEAADNAAASLFGDRVMGTHQIAFWSDTELALGDVVVMRVDGVRVCGSVSEVRSVSGNPRKRYTTGDLCTTLTQKLKRGDSK